MAEVWCGDVIALLRKTPHSPATLSDDLGDNMSELIEELKRYAETAPGCMINGNRLAPLLRKTVAKLEAAERLRDSAFIRPYVHGNEKKMRWACPDDFSLTTHYPMNNPDYYWIGPVRRAFDKEQQ